MAHVSTPPKRLSCDRCRAQKLRCPRQGPGSSSCSRCVRRGAQCVYSAPLPKGRPRIQRPSTTHADTNDDLWLSSRFSDAPTVVDEWSAPASGDEDSESSIDDEGTFGIHSPQSVVKTADGVPTGPKIDLIPQTGKAPSFSQRSWGDVWNGVRSEPVDVQQDYQKSDLNLQDPIVLADSLQDPSLRFVNSPQAARRSSHHHSRSEHTLQKPDVNRTGNLKTSSPFPPSKSANQSDQTQRAVLKSREESDFKSVDDLSLNYASRPSHLETSFWATIPGQEQIRNRLANCVYQPPSPTKSSWYNVVGLANLLKDLPGKQTCDVFLHSFNIAVRPAFPLVNMSVFHRIYDKFWFSYEHKSHDIAPPSNFDDPTFIPLLFSVLYCGAIVAPSSIWQSAEPLGGLDARTTVECLENSYLAGLDHCQHLKHPALNTLVASVLGRGCSRAHRAASEDLSYVNTVVRLAQTLGLHRKHAGTDLSPTARESYRRIWWHIVSLDTICSLRYGSKTCCGVEGDQWDVEMMSEVSDEAISEFQPRCFTSVPTPVSNKSSVFMLFAIGRYETVRFTHGLLSQVNGCHSFDKDNLKSHMDAYKKLHIKITTLINRMPTQGIPEKGFVPYRVMHASMLTHGNLYSDQSQEPSTFISWARITLTMLLKSSLLGLWKVLLGYPNLVPETHLWTSISRLSIDVIRHLLQIVRVPSFEPFFWLLTSDVSLYQAILVALSYLKLNPSCPDIQTASYFIDEALDILEGLEAVNTNPGSHSTGVLTSLDSTADQRRSVLRTLRAMRNDLDTSLETRHGLATMTNCIENTTSDPVLFMENSTRPKILTNPSDLSSSYQHSQRAASTSPSRMNGLQSADVASRTGYAPSDNIVPAVEGGYFSSHVGEMEVEPGPLCVPPNAASDLLEFAPWHTAAMLGSEDIVYQNIADQNFNFGNFLSNQPPLPQHM